HGARCGSRRDDCQVRGHAACGRHQQPAPGALSAADVEPVGGEGGTLMRRMHDYKGWRFGLTALVHDGRWSARIEVYEPGRPSREQSPMPLGFATKASWPGAWSLPAW